MRKRHEPILLLIGDLTLLYAALFLALFLREGNIPPPGLFAAHLLPFSLLFIAWVFVFFVAGLYEKHTLIFRRKLPRTLFNSQALNAALAVIFFYVVPFFTITPKTVLALQVLLSSGFILAWRLFGVSLLHARPTERAVLIGTGEEVRELFSEVNNNPRHGFSFAFLVDLEKESGIDVQKEIVERMYSEGITTVVLYTRSGAVTPILPHLYNLIFSRTRFINMYSLYEEVFDRVPLSLLSHSWFVENISSSHAAYDALKRAMDISISFVLFLVSLILYPFVYLAIKLDDGGPVFIMQERIGEGNKIVKTIKFRSMNVNDAGVWPTKGDRRITRVGRFLRTTRIDELPQLWNVLLGDMSLIGPRPDIIGLGKELESKIPYYTIRNLIKPGLSGWAQIKQDFPPHTLEETRARLAYDLYYLKNRSFFLDLKIALKTIKTLLSRSGK